MYVQFNSCVYGLVIFLYVKCESFILEYSKRLIFTSGICISSKKLFRGFIWCVYHCVKSVLIRSYSGPHFPTFGLNTVRYCLSPHIQCECGRIWTGITPSTDTFYAVFVWWGEYANDTMEIMKKA